MQPTAFISIIIIVINLIVSYKGFKDPAFYERYLFKVDNILIGREYSRLLVSGFIHTSWMHLIFNMVSLYLFSYELEFSLGHFPFFIVYMAGLLGGNLLALLIHKQHGDYSAAGASGAVNGVIFAAIALFPGMKIGMILPIYIPGWIYGLAYILYTIYAIKTKAGNVGHEAHLGGALVGMFTALLFHPYMFYFNYITILLISVPSLVFLYIIITRPHVLLTENFKPKPLQNATIEDRYNYSKREQQKEIDAILEKIHQKGVNSLTTEEKEKLDRYSKNG